MSAMSLRLPESLHDAARELAAREGISVNQLVATALAEKLSALMTEEYLEERAKRGSRKKFLAAMAQVPDVEPEPWDRLPERVRPGGRSRRTNTSKRSRK
ncbi:MAG: toxin-antitoxin system HicB family antitoxin [Planctomycetales bacterium]